MGSGCSTPGAAFAPTAAAPPANHQDSALWTQASLGQTDEVRKLLAEGANIKERSLDGLSPLHAAATAGHEDVVLVLIEHSADVAAKDLDAGETALHAAAFEGHAAVVLLLLDHAADVSAADSEGRTSLHKASSRGHEAVVLLLLEHAADVSAASSEGGTAIDYANQEGHAAITQMLFQHGGRPGAEAREKVDPGFAAMTLHVAASLARAVTRLL